MGISENSQLNRILSRTVLIDRSFLSVCGLVIILLFLRDVSNVSVSKWIFVFLSGLIYVFYDLNYMFVFTCFLTPFLVGLPGSYIFAIGLVVFLAKNLRELVISKYILAPVLILVVELLSFMYGSFSLFDFFKFAVIILFTAVLIFTHNEEVDFRKGLTYFILAAVSAQLLVILQSVTVYGLTELVDAGVRLGNTEKLLAETGMRISFNPNEFGRLCTFTLSILLMFLYRRANPRIIVIGLIIVQILVGSFSLSRNFLIILAMITVVYMMASSSSMGKFMKAMAQTAAIALAVYLAVSNLFPNIYDGFVSRFMVADVSGGRVNITREYFAVISENPERLFLGVGIQDYEVKSDMDIVSHNGTQEVLITWGIMGLLLVITYIYGIYRHSGIRDREDVLIYLLPLLAIIVGVQSGQFFSGRSPIYLLPAYMTMGLAGQNPSSEPVYLEENENEQADHSAAISN